MIQSDVLEKIIQRGPEILVFKAIKTLGAYRFNLERAIKRGETQDSDKNDEEIRNLVSQQKRLLGTLYRFGVKDIVDKIGNPTENYWKWYRWWDSWDKSLSDIEWRAIDKKVNLDMLPEEIKQFRPGGSWNEKEISCTSSL